MRGRTAWGAWPSSSGGGYLQEVGTSNSDRRAWRGIPRTWLQRECRRRSLVQNQATFSVASTSRGPWRSPGHFSLIPIRLSATALREPSMTSHYEGNIKGSPCNTARQRQSASASIPWRQKMARMFWPPLVRLTALRNSYWLMPCVQRLAGRNVAGVQALAKPPAARLSPSWPSAQIASFLTRKPRLSSCSRLINASVQSPPYSLCCLPGTGFSRRSQST